MRHTFVPVLFAMLLPAMAPCDEALIAHWPLAENGKDVSGNGLHAASHGVDFSAIGPSGTPKTAAAFDGQHALLEIPTHERLQLGTKDFSVSLWVHADSEFDDVPGDLISQYDPATHTGFHLGLKTSAGVTFSQANVRHLQFGVDQDRPEESWLDCGSPGNALLAFALCEYAGDLYAGTCEPGRDDAGHVYRYAGDDNWIDCGAPDRSNSVTSLAVFQGQLYAGTGKYRVAGSSLPESENTTPGGGIFRYDGESKWIDCGHLAESEAVGGMVVYRNRLYASSLYRPAGFFRYEGGTSWKDGGSPPRPDDLPGDTTQMRVEAMGVYNGYLYATSYDGGRVFRFDGESWLDCGQLADNTQSYAFAILEGRLYVGTWPSGRVYRFEKPHQWTDVGRLGEELEVMGMLVHNGRLIAGTLPLAEVYEFDHKSSWKKLTRLDHTPEVRYRRAWTMAEHDGRLFCSTLPSGKVWSWRAGRVAMSGTAFPPGWHHVAAVRSSGSIKLFIDGLPAAEQSDFSAADYDLSGGQPLRIGFGPNDYFKGKLSDVRLYGRALLDSEIQLDAEDR
jgi:hypothetical protein